ncbi:MAG: MgtC/SapB family protein [Lysobacteraceae bacterium]|nr:MAG: MgtC/SapB family protein [Xanthomonadaceae bacterium]
MPWHNELMTVAIVAYAMVLGGVVGFERELKNRPAGFRTHMLVAGAAALLVEIGQLVVQGSSGGDAGTLRVDPLRLVEAVISGVAFIGAGTIFARRSEDSVEGITTAASLLMVAVIGVAAGFGHHAVAIGSTVLTLLVLTVLNVVEKARKVAAGSAKN